MQDNANSELLAPKQIPWNKGKLTGREYIYNLYAWDVFWS